MTETPQPPIDYVDGTPFFGRAEQQKRFRTLLRELRDPERQLRSSSFVSDS